MSEDIISDKRYSGLEPHPTRSGVLRSIWKVKAVSACVATGLKVRVGPIVAESIVEVLESEAQKFSHIKDLQFSKKRYSMRTDQKGKKICILAPISLISIPTPVQVSVDSKNFEIIGQQILRPDTRLNVSFCDLMVKCKGKEESAKLTAQLGVSQAISSIVCTQPAGANISIKIEDVDYGNQRYRWKSNVLEIAARHPSLKRYLGEKEKGFPGQEEKHFRVILAEVVADAVCARVVQRNVRDNPEQFEDADWDQYYADYSRYMTRFLPIAHKLQCSEL